MIYAAFSLVLLTLLIVVLRSKNEKQFLEQLNSKLISKNDELTTTTEKLSTSKKELEDQIRTAEEILTKMKLEEQGEKQIQKTELEKREALIRELKEKMDKVEKDTVITAHHNYSLKKAYADLKSQFDRAINEKNEIEKKSLDLGKKMDDLAADKEGTSLGTIVIKR